MSPIGSHVTSTAESVSYRKHNTLGTPKQLCMLRMRNKGHTIGFCCAKSSGYTGGWDRMSEVPKDAFVTRFVK